MGVISQVSMNWLRPTPAIRQLLKRPSLNRLHLSIVAFLSITYILQVAIFLSSIEKVSPLPYTNAQKIKAVVYGCCFAYALLYGILQFFSLLGWKIAQLFSGKGGLAETRLVLSWWLVCTSPIGFLFLIFQYTYNHPDVSGVMLIDGVGFIGVPFIFFYGWVVLLKAMAEVHQFSVWKALSVCLLTGFFLSLGTYLILRSSISHW